MPVNGATGPSGSVVVVGASVVVVVVVGASMVVELVGVGRGLNSTVVVVSTVVGLSVADAVVPPLHAAAMSPTATIETPRRCCRKDMGTGNLQGRTNWLEPQKAYRSPPFKCSHPRQLEEHDHPGSHKMGPLLTLRAMAGQIHLERAASVATIVIDQPNRRNAISRDMWRGLLAAAKDVGQDRNTRVVVLRGAGDAAFAAGADISQFEDQRSDGNTNTAYDDTTAAATSALARLPMPLIAAIHGYCIGGGLAVALTADIRITADDGQFAIPAARLGLGYGHAGIGILMSLVGPSIAKHILFTARRFSATEALQMGLVNSVEPKRSLDASVAELCDQIADNAPMTIAAVKATITQLLRDSEDRNFVKVDELIRACFDSADYGEGIAAFLEKRSPNFKGV